MKLTKAQRHAYYKQALELFLSGTSDGALCLVLNRLIGWDTYTMAETRDIFPEFKRKKPKNKVMGISTWWPDTEIGRKKRANCLRQCIRETAPKSK